MCAEALYTACVQGSTHFSRVFATFLPELLPRPDPCTSSFASLLYWVFRHPLVPASSFAPAVSSRVELMRRGLLHPDAALSQAS